MSRLPLHYSAKLGFYEITDELLMKDSDQTVINAIDVFGK